MPTQDYINQVVCIDCLELLKRLDDNSLDLIITSPPYSVVKRGARISGEYKDVGLTEYNDWFIEIAKEMKRVLKESGSFVLNINTFTVNGQRDLYIFKLLIRLVEEVGFKLIQDCLYVKPPSIPSGLVSKYTRMKEAFEYIWWFGKTINPKANAKSVLMKYSEAFESDIRDVSKRHLLGTLNDAKRYTPSGHNIVPSRMHEDHGGSIPINYVYGSLSDSGSDFMEEWKRQGLDIHPARFPEILPKFYTLMLTEQGDIVYDPFTGSGTSLAVAKSLGRRYIGSELSPVFAKAAEIRIAMTNVHKLDADAKLEEFDSERIDSA